MRYTAGIGSCFGIPVRVHATFPLILIVYAADAWRTVGATEALRAVGLVLAVFACVVLHELGHSLVARRYGIRVRDIVLLPIGGVARAESLPENPRHEIAVAAAGPVVSFTLAAVLFGVAALTPGEARLDRFAVDLGYVNALVLGVFNLIPAFPMDGGRILRGLLAQRRPYLDATRRARDVGQILALGFAALAFIDPSFVMLALIAVFVFVGGMAEERAIAARVRLVGRPVGDLTDADAIVFATSESVETAASRAGGRRAPAYAIAGDSGALAGVVSTADLLRALREGGATQALASIARSDFPVAEARTEAAQVHRYLLDARKPFAAVVDGDRFVGLFHTDPS